jgi:hypothetical protein
MTICVVYGPTPEGAAVLALALREARVHGTRLVAPATGRQELSEHDHLLPRWDRPCDDQVVRQFLRGRGRAVPGGRCAGSGRGGALAG